MLETITLAEWLQRGMEIRDLTYREVAERLGVHLSTVHHWARGLSKPSPSTQARLMEVMATLPPRPKPAGPRSKADLRRPSAFAMWLADRKREQGLSVSELATALNVGKGTVSGWLAGRNEPMPETCERLAVVLGVSLDTINQTLEEG